MSRLACGISRLRNRQDGHPLYAGVAPHEQIVTQYSLHIRDHDKADLEHLDFLADHSKDCRRELAERLLTDTQGCETVFVYSSFEKTVLGNLALRFPDLAQGLESLGPNYLISCRLFGMDMFILISRASRASKWCFR